MLPQSLLVKLAQAQTPEAVEEVLKDALIVEMYKEIKQFNRNTGILLHDFRGILENIGARFE